MLIRPRHYLIVAITLFCAALAWSDTAYVIDVRSPDEFSAGHLDGALLMPHNDIAALIEAAGIDHSSPIQLYCQSGRRAAIAQQTLRQLGFTNITNLGGYDALVRQADDANCDALSC